MSQGLIDPSHPFMAQGVKAPPKTLTDAFNASKKSRQVMSKQIIWESGVSKSQFYRVLSGKETPSAETKTRMSKSLNIDTDEFDVLHEASGRDDEVVEISPNSQRLVKPLLLLLSIVIIGLFLLFTVNSQRPNSIVIDKVVTNPDDSTLFIKDVTIPDGTAIPVDTTFVKTWRVKNTGKIVWKNRYLKRVTPQSEHICSSPAMVPIPETLPGETVDISVIFITPHLPGSCRTDWKSADQNGNFHFPDMHGLFSIVTVTD